ncbi:Alkylated DNA repair dioxygenase AlkB [Gillisia sp. Hel1_33_143]|uniref:alpha-ketoglutarate-dependent dioxygenase AlkB family protein n=1 Tax=Gillisia sp. Hel1_33_143 TaxID=1336796 RepID=UPI00087ABAB2|nr:alpha-ketoglutarate-dependent dioxygenase AlkB [Gillisia sp. Hel1_33_143]SDS29999.1 Alkylated DNA repair dioxygenase AlkB [Gillisia sp. Hel1_33_143]
MKTDLKIYDLIDAEIWYYPNFLSAPIANTYYNFLLNNLDWKQYDIKIFGKLIPQPRLASLYAINSQAYSYSNLTLHPKSYPSELLNISKELEKLTDLKFTHCLANLYRNGNDSMGWHADNEKELGPNPIIASVSLGAERKFQLKHKERKDQRFELHLKHGSLLIMKGKTQHFWKHQLPKTKKIDTPRINLTFRTIL